jgi:hypothetical protein
MKYLTEHPEILNRLAKTVLLAYARYPTTDNTNLFVVGKIGERALLQALENCGYAVTDVSTLSRVDIQVGIEKFSVKTSINTKSVTLCNYRGNKRPISELPPTFLILFNREIGKMYVLFVDNTLIETTSFAKKKYNHSDSNLTLTETFIKHLVKTLGPDRMATIDMPTLESEHCVVKNMMDFVWHDIQSCV